MSSPIPIPSSSKLYVPVHRRNQSTGSSYSGSSRTPSPSPSEPLIPPYVYTPTDLLSLAHSPLAERWTADMDAQLRAIAPEVVQTRKQRKALAWHARHPTPLTSTPASSGSRARRHMPRRGSHSHTHTSESEEDRASTWRRV